MENITAESTGFSPPSVGADTLFEDRYDAARRLAADLPSKFARDTVVVAVSHGGAEVAAEVARTLRLPLDIVVVRKIRHPQAPERVLGAVAPGYAVYVRAERDSPTGRSRSRPRTLDVRSTSWMRASTRAANRSQSPVVACCSSTMESPPARG